MQNNEQIMNIRIGNLFKRRREKLGLSLKDLSVSVSLTPTQISRIENAQLKKPAFIDLMLLANFYHLPIEEIIKYARAEKKEKELEEQSEAAKLLVLVKTIVERGTEDQHRYVKTLLAALLNHFHQDWES